MEWCRYTVYSFLCLNKMALHAYTPAFLLHLSQSRSLYTNVSSMITLFTSFAHGREVGRGAEIREADMQVTQGSFQRIISRPWACNGTRFPFNFMHQFCMPRHFVLLKTPFKCIASNATLSLAPRCKPRCLHPTRNQNSSTRAQFSAWPRFNP